MSENSGVGMPAALHLEQFGEVCSDFFGVHVYQVGSSLRGNKWRDVDVRVILDDAIYAALGLGDPENTHTNRKWIALTLAFSALGKQMTGLPIDFQVQQMTYANAKFSRGKTNGRSALGIQLSIARHSDCPSDLLEPARSSGADAPTHTEQGTARSSGAVQKP